MVKKLPTKKGSIAGKAVFFFLFVTSIAFLSFVLGTAVMQLKISPLYPSLRDAYKAAIAWRSKLKPRDRHSGSLFDDAYSSKTNVLRHDPKQSDNGYTLFTSAHAQKALLISIEGDIIHEWELPFSKAWPSPPHIKSFVDDEYTYFRSLHLYPHGDLLILYENENDTPNGYGIVKIDKNSQIVWKYAERTHHDLNVGSDGKIYTLIHEIVTEKITGYKMSAEPWLKDSIVVLSSEGKELKRVDIAKAIANSDYADLLLVSGFSWDYFHTNTVKVLNPEQAAQFPLFKAGQVIISLRAQSAIAVVDLEQEKVVWAARGSWIAQHDPDFLDNGHILLFDNRGNISKGGRSRILEIDPQNLSIVWEYRGNEREPFNSPIRSMQQRLPNGNTLITDSETGRLFEVTPAKKIVWEYSSPFRDPNDRQRVGIITWSERFAPEALKFDLSKPKLN